ncbi:MAG: hypothetical protein ACFCUU_03980, partial [Cyclobacteriaceae bacterium]
RYLYFSALLAPAYFLAACSEELDIQPKTATMVLTGTDSKAWQLVSYRYAFDEPEIAGIDTLDWVDYNDIPTCAVDDVWIFYRQNKQVDITEGPTKCNPEFDDLIATTSWEVVHATASLYLGGGEPFRLLQLNENRLQIGIRDTLAAPVIFRDRFMSAFIEFPGYFLYDFVPQN